MQRLYHAPHRSSISSGNQVTVGTMSITSQQAARLKEILRLASARTLRETPFREKQHYLSLTTILICRIFAKEHFSMAVSIILLTTLAVR